MKPRKSVPPLQGRTSSNVGPLSCSGLLSRLAYRRAQQMGLNVQDALRNAGLTVKEMADQAVHVPVSNEIRFVRSIAEKIGDRNLGIRLARAYDPREIGFLYYVAASADTLGEALLRVQRYSLIANDAIVVKVEKADLVRAKVRYAAVARHLDTHQIEFWIASLLRVCRHLTTRRLNPVRIRIMHRTGAKSREIEKLVAAKVEIESDDDELILPSASWNYPVRSSDPYLQRLCVQYCEEALQRRETRGSPLQVRVENAAAALMPHGKVSLASVAAHLGMSVRTLTRRLAADQTSFAEIIRNLRLALARRYLADGELSISQIAWVLGYSEVGTFSRAFQSWTGLTPSSVRSGAKPIG